MISTKSKGRLNPMLVKVLLVSILLHVILGVIAGLVTIATHVIKEETQFEEPPAVAEEKPPMETKVQIQQQVPQQEMRENLRMQPLSNIAVSSINVDLPTMEQSFTVSSGLGGIVGQGNNLLGSGKGGLNIGTSNVSVFGLKTRAERILFVIDVNRQMVTDNKGGLNSYRVIKDEITDMIGNLSAGTLFNVMLHDRNRTLFFKPRLAAAGSSVHQELVRWISGINNDAKNIGLEGIREAKRPELTTLADDPINKALPMSYRSNDTAFLTQKALEQKVDAVFFVTGYHRGFEAVRRKMNEEEQKAWDKKISDSKYQKQLAEHLLEKPEMEQRVKTELAQQNAERAKKGLPPRVLDRRHGVYTQSRELGLEWKVPHPGPEPKPEIEPKDIEKYFKKLNRILYEDRDRKVPSLNVVLLLAENEVFPDQSEEQLKEYTRFFRGKYRIIRGEKEIRSSRSSKETKN